MQCPMMQYSAVKLYCQLMYLSSTVELSGLLKFSVTQCSQCFARTKKWSPKKPAEIMIYACGKSNTLLTSAIDHSTYTLSHLLPTFSRTTWGHICCRGIVAVNHALSTDRDCPPSNNN